MMTVYEEIMRRFPELDNEITRENRDLAYIQMAYIVEWLQSMPRGTHTANIVERLKSFRAWCEDQPRTENPEDDIYTIFIIGFWEHMFESDSTRALIPQLMSREEVIAGGDYLKSWVGPENYQMALDEYDRCA
jgi:hypothetical protein